MNVATSGKFDLSESEPRAMVLVMEIRDATEADLPQIVGIYNQSIPGGKSTADLAEISIDSRREWFGEFHPDRHPCWVAIDEGRVVGCVYLRPFSVRRPAYAKTAEISTYLERAHQGRGLGTELKRRMIEKCPDLGITTLLSYTFDHNHASRRVNEKLGFIEAGHFPEIAEVFGERRGLIIAMLRIPPRTEDPGKKV